ncbi:MAG: PBP1A family penicillin-binding protein [Patescibacteria group bacterium]
MRLNRGKQKGAHLFIRLGAAFFAFSSLAALAYGYFLIRDLPNPERITERSVAQSTKIYDRKGEVLLYEIFGEERRTVIPFKDIPARVRWAAIAAEDRRFYEHMGLDIRGILRALARNVSARDISQGGSTITQQLVKNSLLTTERTWSRKFKEAILAIALETKYSKDDILEWYLNQIPYGSNAYGIAAAADIFFGKSVNDLTMAQSALLAALPKAPTYYSPYGSHKTELLERKNMVLDDMEALGAITSEEGVAAKREKIAFATPRQSLRAPHFLFYVRELLNQKYGEQAVERGGLRVITTLDWNLQQSAERIVREGAARNEALVQAHNAALVALDPRSGEILAMVGSRDYFDVAHDGNVNVTTRPRQPGSAFKPFVYATAFAKGFTPATVLFDVPTEFNALCSPSGLPGPRVTNATPCYHPKNYDNRFRGPVTLRQALAQSLNVPSVKLLYLVGVNDAIETARAFGISTLGDPRRYGLSLVLGGAEVTLLDMASAYGAFARDGILYPKTAILKITDARGSILEQKNGTYRRVIEENIARTMNDILSDNAARVPVFSPQSSLYFSDRTVAAKTGTTQDYRDAWIIGYTPSLVAGVWVGNNDNTPMNQEGLSVMVAGPIWHNFMDTALGDAPAESFAPPDKLRAEKPALNGAYRTGGVVRLDTVSGKLATEYTPPEYIKEIGVGQTDTILAFVDKKNPSGPPPTNPATDAQYINWGAAVRQWTADNQEAPAAIPHEFDDVHTPEKYPRIAFESPDDNARLSSPLALFSVSIASTYQLKEVSAFLDNAIINSFGAPIRQTQFLFSLGTNDQAPGEHRLRVVAYDAVGNKTIAERAFTFVAP